MPANFHDVTINSFEVIKGGGGGIPPPQFFKLQKSPVLLGLKHGSNIYLLIDSNIAWQSSKLKKYIKIRKSF